MYNWFIGIHDYNELEFTKIGNYCGEQLPEKNCRSTVG